MKLLKKWWFWLILVLFIAINLLMANDKSQPADPSYNQLNQGNIGTH